MHSFAKASPANRSTEMQQSSFATNRASEKTLSGWGGYPTVLCRVIRPERYSALVPTEIPCIARGQGRSSGDAALNDRGAVVLTERINRLLEFDMEAGRLRAESGVTIAEVLEVIVPRGWFLPVTPLTKYVSLGGCVAADVHGTNHHRQGSFGNHILEIELIVGSGTKVKCGPSKEPDAFWATVGGMGLTGIIGEVALKLLPIETAKMVVEHRKAADLEKVFEILDDRTLDDEHTTAWLDHRARGSTLGRGVIARGHHASRDELRDHHVWKPFSAFKVHRMRGNQAVPFVTDYDRCFYRFDMESRWKLGYGSKGLFQYQCIVPFKHAFEGVKALLQHVTQHRYLIHFATLKRLGAESPGPLSFSIPGFTLAMTFSVRKNTVFSLVGELDEIVLRHGGRVHLANDIGLSEESLQAMYPRYVEWLKVKQTVDPNEWFSSNLSRRLGIA